MARKRSLLRTLLFLGAGAALGVLYYRKRNIIRGFFRELFAPAAGPDYEAEIIEFNPLTDTAENDIVIDRTAEEAAPVSQASGS